MSDVTDTTYAAEGIFGHGAQLLMGDDGTPEAFEAVAEVTSIKPGGFMVAVLEKTHLRSPNKHREKKAGLRDTDPTVIELNWKPGHESQNLTGGGSGSFTSGGLLYVMRNTLTKNWKIQLDDSPTTYLPFTGFISKYEIGALNNDGIVPLTVEITPTGDVGSDWG